MKKKPRIGILFGGRSGEHEISLLSGASILKAMDPKKYEIVPIGINKQGRWLSAPESQNLLGTGTTPVRHIGHKTAARANSSLHLSASGDLAHRTNSLTQSLDVIFPVLHGTFGEDGTVQGLLELADIAYVGSGVLGSAAGMDKDIMKKLFATAGLPQTPWLALRRSEWTASPKHTVKRIEKHLDYPLFVKPANAGSSVGISKVHDRDELAPALDLAASFDRKLVVEQGVGGPGVKPRELEVAVLGNELPDTSVVGEIVPNREFYDYQSKYADSPENPSVPIIPADLSKSESKQIRDMAVAAFRACECSGLARVDFLMEPAAGKKHKGQIFLNEINTMPGFTSISMYPKLWEATGLSYPDLIDRLITLALDRHAEKRSTTYTRT